MLRISDDAFPFVIAVVGGDIVEADIREMAARYGALHERGERFYLAQEVRQVNLPTAPMRRQLADLNTEFRARIEKNVIAIGVIVPSRVVSAALTAVYWVSKEAAPTQFFPTAAQLVAHARMVCAAEKVSLPPHADTVARTLDGAWQTRSDLLALDLRQPR